ncbi:MAG: InlB B-repeat-containing protein, partial [Clostridia bacterium]|nr:InlB B-repeat-containing protein [Clostridia bacterium]
EEENGENAYVFGTIILNNDPITLYAVFKPVKYTVTYSLGAAINDEDNPAEYTIASDITLEEPTVPNGYTFVGWFTNDEYETEVTKLGGTTGDVTLYAQYAKTGAKTWTKSGDKYVVTASEYPALLEYLCLTTNIYEDDLTEEEKNDHPGIKVEITEGLEGKDLDYIFAKESVYTMNCTLSVAYPSEWKNLDSIPDDSATLTVHIYQKHPAGTTETGTYEQIPFVYMVDAETGLSDDFIDFPVEHIKTEVNVISGEQLFFALENGYRPVCEAGSVAETLYEEMKNILREILDPGMTEKEICVAVAQYLVDTIEYDNKVLEMFEEVYDELALAYEQKEAAVTEEEKNEADEAIAKANANRSNLAGYRSFYLEGAILDGVAVCDGISKAFTSLTRIMGIESYQVSGRLSGVNHAWNKVFVDLDGNGTKEWTAVDCTGANTALGRGEEKETVEIMNYFYIFATDDFLVTQGYEYADEWDGKFVVVVDYNVYDAFEYDTEKTYYVETKDELNDIMEFYKDEFDATEESALSISIRMPKTLGMDDNKISSDVVEALQLAMFTVDQINN